MITYYFRTVKDDTIKEIAGLRNGVWIHAEGAGEHELSELFAKLGLKDEELLEDAQDFFEVPRLERGKGVLYFFTRYPYNEQKEDPDTAPLLVVLGETFLLTVAQRPVPQFGPFVSGKEIVHTTQKTKLFLQMMDAITISYEKQLVVLRRKIYRERAQLHKITSKEIQQFVNYEHKLNDIVSALVPTNTALQQIMGGKYLNLYESDRELVEDLRIDNEQVVESARNLLKTLQNVRSATEAILTNTLNSRIKTLTVLTILLTIPTVISSLFGMNVVLPLAEVSYGFAVVLLIIVAAVGGMVWYFKKNEWF
jgi:magnesium transporter